MEAVEFEASVARYLVTERGFPQDAVQLEASIGVERKYVDIAIFDTVHKEILALIEVKRTNQKQTLHNAARQMLQYPLAVGKPFIPLYLVAPSASGSNDPFMLMQIVSSGPPTIMRLVDFPSYAALVTRDQSSRKANRSASVRVTVDTFKLTCIVLALSALILCILDITKVLELSVKQLTLAGISAALLILPFAAKFKMLGVEWERHTPK